MTMHTDETSWAITEATGERAIDDMHTDYAYKWAYRKVLGLRPVSRATFHTWAYRRIWGWPS